MTDRKHSIFVGRIDSRVSKGELGDLFRPYGKVVSLFIASQTPGAQFTYGFVGFENEDDATVAISKLNGVFFHGQRLKVELGAERNNESNKTSVQNRRNVRRPWNSRSNETRNSSSSVHQLNFKNERDDQFVWNHGDTTTTTTHGRNDHLSHLTNIYSEVSHSPLLPDGATTLPDLLQWLMTIDRLPLTNGPVYNQKKPKCFLDLDVLDEMSEAYWSEKKEKSSC